MITLTANYTEYLKPETVAFIQKNCVEGDYELADALVFIDENSEEDFIEYYDEYIELGENNGYEAVDAFLTLHDFDDLYRFEKCYLGEYGSPARFAEDFLENEVDRLCYMIVVDWEATAEYLLDHDVDRVGDFYFKTYF